MQQNREEVKASDVTLKQEDINYPRCPLHKIEAQQIPDNDEGWTKYSDRILKCPRCISNGKLDINGFTLLDEVLVQQTQELNRVSRQHAQNDFVGKLGDWLKQLAILQNNIRELTESIHGYIAQHQGGQLTQKLRSYLDACITKETPDYDDFAEKLKTLKQHFSYDKDKIKIMDDLAIFARNVDRQDALLHKMVEDMQSRIAEFRGDILELKPELNDQQINVGNSIEDKPESIVAYSFESGTKTFKYITVDCVKSKDFTYKYKDINHIANFPEYHFAPMAPNGTVYLIGGRNSSQNNNSNSVVETCWELGLKRSTMVQKQSMKNKREAFGGAVVQDKYIQVVAGYDGASPIKSCERQDIAANAWQDIADYPVKAAATACCSFDDRYIYSIGGQVDGAYSKDIYVYDTRNNTWSGVNVDSAPNCGITPDEQKNAVQINQRQIQLLGGEDSPEESCLLEVDEENNNKIKVKESNKINLSKKQTYFNYQNSVIQQGKLQCSQNGKNWAYKTSCFDSQRWQVLQ